MTPAEQRTLRSLAAQLAVQVQLARDEDWTARTEPARKAFRDRFEREVDPEGRLDPVQRARQAEMARKAYFTRLALASAKARAAKKGR
jgi:hypothetical protein